MEQKINSVTSAETNDEVSATVEVSTSSPNNAKPNVGRSLFYFINLFNSSIKFDMSYKSLILIVNFKLTSLFGFIFTSCLL